MKVHFLCEFFDGFMVECGRTQPWLKHTLMPSEVTCEQCKPGIAHLSDEARIRRLSSLYTYVPAPDVLWTYALAA